MATATQEKPKAAKAATLTFHHQNHQHIKDKAAEIAGQFQAMFDALEPGMQKVIPEQFEGSAVELEKAFRKARVKQLPNYEAYEEAGVDLTAQVKLKPAEIDLLEELRNPGFSSGDFHLRPKGSWRYKAGKLHIENLEHSLDQTTLTLSGFEVELYNRLNDLYNSLTLQSPTINFDRLSWFISPGMLSDARQWRIEGKECLINPAAVKDRVEKLSHFV